MSSSESMRALRRANPRSHPGFAHSVDQCADAVRARVTAIAVHGSAEVEPSKRRLVRVSLVGACATALAIVVTALTVGSLGGSPGVEDAAAAIERAAVVSAASAERSGTARVRITHNDDIWGAMTIRWHADDLAFSQDEPSRRRKPGPGMLVVGGTLYGFEDGGWVVMGSPNSIDPDSGVTPGEYLAAVREDVGGATLRRITAGMTGLTTRRTADGSTVYAGALAAGRLARETGFKEGEAIRVFPFGYVAHGEAADPAALLQAEVTVGGDGLVRRVAASWGNGGSAWTYTVDYSGLGASPALVAPGNARPLREVLREVRPGS